MAKGSGKVRGITIELTADTAGIMDGLKDINKQLSQTDKALKDTNKLLKFDENNTELVAQQQQYLAQAIEQTEEKLKKEKELLSQLQNADNASETVEQQNALKREIESTTQKLNSYKSQLKDTNDALEEVKDQTEEAKTATNNFAEIVKANLTSEVIISAVKKLADGIKEISSAAFDAGSSFEASMSQVAATMGMTSQEIQNGSQKYKLLSDAAKLSGETTMFSASQAADALNYLALAGYDAEKAAATLPKVLTLAAAGGMDLAYASDLVTDSMSAMGMETEELDNYIDEMTKTAQKANTSVAQLGEATLVCAGTVTLTGQKLETMNAELGVLANNGIKGAEGGTHLRNILLSLSAPTDKAAAALENLHVTTTDSKGDLRDLNDIMIDLSAALDGMGSAEKAAVIKSIFNKTDIAAVNALMKGTTGEFQNLKNEISNCEGAADNMAKTMTDNLQGKLTILSSALEGLGIAFYEVFDDNAKDAVDGATDAVGQLTDQIKNGNLGESLAELSDQLDILIEDVINFAMDALPGAIDGATWFLEHLGEITSLLEGLGAGYVAYEVGVLAATIATEGFTAALSLNPIGLAVGAIAGLTVAFTSLVDEMNQLPPEIESLSRSAEHMASKTNSLASETDKLGSNFEGEAQLANRLKGELDKLIDPETELVTDTTRAKAIITELNELIPGLNLSLSDQGQIISDATDSWEDYIDVMLQQAQLEAMNERLIELQEQKIDQELKLMEIDSQITDETKELIAASEEYADLSERINDLTDEEYQRMDQLEQILHPLDDAQSQLVQDYQEGEDALNALNSSEDTLLQLMEESRDKINAATEATEEYSDATDGAGESVVTLGGLLDELCEDYAKAKEDAVKSLEGQREAFENMDEGASESVDQIAEHLKTQAENMKEYADLIGEAQAIMEVQPDSSGLLNYYISAGPEAAGELENLVNAFNEGGEAAESFKEACAAFEDTQTLIDGLADLNIALETGSTEAIQLALEQLEVDLPAMEAAFQESWAQQEEDANTHKEEMSTAMTNTVTGMAQAVTTNEPTLTTAVKTMGDNAFKQLQTAWQWSEENQRFMVFYNAGMKVDESLAAGITDGTSLVSEAITAMCEAAVEAVDISGLAQKIDAAIASAMD